MAQNWLAIQAGDYRDFSFDLYGFRHLFDELVDKNKLILEIGCGNGYFLERLKNGGYKRIIGIDVVEAAVKESFNRSGFPILLMDAHSTDFLPSLFDVIIASHVIEHSPVPRALIRELWRILKPRGLLFAEIPIESSPSEGGGHFSWWSNANQFKELILLENFKIIKERQGYDKLDDRTVGGKENHYYVVAEKI